MRRCDWRETPAFMVELRKRDSFGARALEFLILTAVRSGEVRGATWKNSTCALAPGPFQQRA